MPKTPIGDDESSAQRPRRTHTPRPTQNAYVQRRKQREAASDAYYDDEQLSVPKIRRASRFVEDDQPLPAYTNRLPIVELADDVVDEETEETTSSHETGKIMVSPRPRRRPYIYEPASDPQSPSVQSQRVRRPLRQSGSTRSQRPQPAPTTPRPKRPHDTQRYARYGRREKRQHTHTLLTALQDFSHNRTLVTITLVIALALIFVPILVTVTTNTLYSNSTGGMIASGGQNTDNGQQTSTQGVTITPPMTDHPAPPVFATSAYLLDVDTGATLYAHNPFIHLPMMSTTKLMTAALAIEKGNLDQSVTINDAITKDLGTLSADSSVMGIKKGETYTLRELMYGLFLVSGNDAAIAIGDVIAGNQAAFMAMMNDKANTMGLRDTHYINPHGLLATGHYSSAHDLAMLGKYVMGFSQLRAISGTRTYTIAKSGDHPQHTLVNGNQFLWWYPGVDGGKPGWDGDANFVQVISCIRNGHHLIGVTMHTKDWWTDMRDLMNWGFNDFTWVSPHDVDAVHPIPFDNLWGYFNRDNKDATIAAVNGGRYYIYTGYSVADPILAYFDKNGGIGKLGYPTSALTKGGGPTVSQRFEHGTIQCDTGSKQCKTR